MKPRVNYPQIHEYFSDDVKPMGFLVRICRKCRHLLPPDHQYCEKCGHIVIHDPLYQHAQPLPNK
ncbi:MAG: hypothetical protein NWE83_02535 [Candidatus Bathyarchaeota archaeon]|nr:hypothetical protein [Candidatus Bathyarchaeota archaeon]